MLLAFLGYGWFKGHSLIRVTKITGHAHYVLGRQVLQRSLMMTAIMAETTFGLDDVLRSCFFWCRNAAWAWIRTGEGDGRGGRIGFIAVSTSPDGRPAALHGMSPVVPLDWAKSLGRAEEQLIESEMKASLEKRQRNDGNMRLARM